jgi:phosphatidylinositol glycan class M
MNNRLLYNALTQYPFTIGLALRLVAAWLLPLLLDDGKLIPGVAYTDVDYHVFSDAANYIRNGESPYRRHTYRYTPFLALILAKVNGRYLFCLADALCGKLILHLQMKMQQKKQQQTVPQHPLPSPTLASCLMWMYNPLVINICTRGSAESFIVLLPVLLTVAVAQSDLPFNSKSLLAGVLHGVAVHAKVYPVIYTLTFMVYLARPTKDSRSINSVSTFVSIWFRRLFQPAPIVFALACVGTFVGLTYLAVLFYGDKALQEGLLYHLSRVDHRHNYSMWWYPIYLARRQVPGAILMLPQLILLLVTSLIRPEDLGWTLFLQTYIFVTFNKVITAQYFTWYLCLLPLCRFHDSPRLRLAGMFVVASILFWLASAYLLELQGLPVPRLVWFASVVYFAANIHMLRVLIQSTLSLSQPPLSSLALGTTSRNPKKD